MTRRRARAALVTAVLIALTACSGSDTDSATPTTLAPTAPITALTTTVAPTTVAPTTTAATTTVSTTTTVTPASTATTASPATSTTSIAGELAPARYDALTVAAFELITDNLAISVSVHRPGTEPWGLAAGWRNDGDPTTTDTPFVIASVSKLVTALSIARLVQQGELTVGDRVPWDAMGIAHDPAWDDVTVRELLDHTSGMPINRKSWLDDPGPCTVPLAEAMALPPELTRGEWTYSNGNYCALGLLVEHLTDDDAGDP